MGLLVTTTLAGEQSNSLIFHDNIKCITANGHMIIFTYAGANYCHVTIIHFVQDFFRSTKPSLIYACGFGQHHIR